jgi:hypothetical protein
LPFSGLAIAAVPAAAVHAGTPPTIKAQGGDISVSVNGTGFTPSIRVRVTFGIYHSKTKKWSLENKVNTNSTSTGTISAGSWSAVGKVRARAYDTRTHLWSNWSITTVRQLQ